MRAAPLALVALLPCVEAGAVHWYLGSYDTRYIDENAAFVSKHRDVIDGVLHCCTGPTVLANGTVAPPDEQLFSGLAKSDRAAGLDPVMLPISPSSDAILARVAAAAVPALVQWAVTFNISGFVSDYEPHDNTTAAHSAAVPWSATARTCSTGGIAVQAPALWSPRSPVQYTAVIELLDATAAVMDRQPVRFGIRHLEIVSSGARMLLLSSGLR